MPILNSFANGESNVSLNLPNFSGNFCNLPKFWIVPFAAILGLKIGNVSNDSGLCVNTPAVIALPKICRTKQLIIVLWEVRTHWGSTPLTR